MWRSLVDNYIWAHQCWPAGKNSHSSVICGYCTPSKGHTKSNFWRGRKRESREYVLDYDKYFRFISLSLSLSLFLFHSLSLSLSLFLSLTSFYPQAVVYLWVAVSSCNEEETVVCLLISAKNRLLEKKKTFKFFKWTADWSKNTIIL